MKCSFVPRDLHPVERGAPDGVAGDLAVGDRLGDPHDLLVDDAAGADVLVADLAVAHHAVGHADVEPARLHQRHGIIRVQHVVARLAREDGGVELVLLRMGVLAPAVADDEEHGSAVVNSWKWKEAVDQRSRRDRRRLMQRFSDASAFRNPQRQNPPARKTSRAGSGRPRRPAES